MAFDFSRLPQNLGTVEVNGEEYEVIRKTTYYSGKEVYDLRSLETGEFHKLTYCKPDPYYEKRSDSE
jgi:hypothetical protein